MSYNVVEHLVVFVSKAFGELKHQHSVGNMEAILKVDVIFLELLGNGGYSRNIDRHGIYGLLSLYGFGDINANSFVYVSVKLRDKSVCLKYGKEGSGGSVNIIFGIIPADKRFTARDLIFHKIEFRLIEDYKLATRKCALCLRFNVRLLYIHLFKRGIIKLDRLFCARGGHGVFCNYRLIQHGLDISFRIASVHLIHTEVELERMVLLLERGVFACKTVEGIKSFGQPSLLFIMEQKHKLSVGIIAVSLVNSDSLAVYNFKVIEKLICLLCTEMLDYVIKILDLCNNDGEFSRAILFQDTVCRSLEAKHRIATELGIQRTELIDLFIDDTSADNRINEKEDKYREDDYHGAEDGVDYIIARVICLNSMIKTDNAHSAADLANASHRHHIIHTRNSYGAGGGLTHVDMTLDLVNSFLGIYGETEIIENIFVLFKVSLFRAKHSEHLPFFITECHKFRLFQLFLRCLIKNTRHRRQGIQNNDRIKKLAFLNRRVKD